MAVRLLFLLCCVPLFSQVGIDTTNPLQKLHIGSESGTVRVESLNADNSPFNGGDVDNDGDLSNNTYPLYVDALGNLTTEFKPLYNSNGSDAVDDAAIPVNFVNLPATDPDGIADVQITLFEVEVARPAILEVKYNLSFDIFLNAGRVPISDNFARRVSTYFIVSGVGTRKYGPVSKCYSSGSALSVTGTMYNASTAYIQLPAEGKYEIQFYGEVSSNIKGGGGGTPSKAAYVEFAAGYDAIFLRLH